jgi:hypothetical protein
MTERPNPYAEFRALAVTLEGEGVPVDEILDAAFQVAVHGGVRSSGREATAAALRDMAELVASPDLGREPVPVVH